MKWNLNCCFFGASATCIEAPSNSVIHSLEEHWVSEDHLDESEAGCYQASKRTVQERKYIRLVIHTSLRRVRSRPLSGFKKDSPRTTIQQNRGEHVCHHLQRAGGLSEKLAWACDADALLLHKVHASPPHNLHCK